MENHNSKPSVHLGLLSELAKTFLSEISLGDLQRGDQTFQDSFRGSDAVDFLSSHCNLKTGSAIQIAQLLLNDRVFFPTTQETVFENSPDAFYSIIDLNLSRKLSVNSAEKKSQKPALPCGIITALAPCYSPTCSSQRLCYSSTCSRASWRMRASDDSTFLEPSLESKSKPSIIEKEKAKYWSTSVSPEIIAKVDKHEIKRQEVIYEIIYTEEDFIEDLKILNQFYRKPFLNGTFEVENREKWIEETFGNLEEMLEVSQKFLDDLKERQGQNPIVDHIGDILVKHVPHLDIYTKHSGHELQVTVNIQRLQRTNQNFKEYCESQERSIISRRLPVKHFISRAKGRLVKFPLLLESLLKATPEGNKDTQYIPKAMQDIKMILSKIDELTGIVGEKIRKAEFKETAVFGKDAGTLEDLDLDNPDRKFIDTGMFLKKGKDEEVHVYLFDNVLVIAKKSKPIKEHLEFSLTISKKPIPLPLLIVVSEEEAESLSMPSQETIVRADASKTSTLRQKYNTARRHTTTGGPPSPISNLSKTLTARTFTPKGLLALGVLGKQIRFIYLKAPTLQGKDEWTEKIQDAQNALNEKTSCVKLTPILSNLKFKTYEDQKINCCVPFESGYVMGAEHGVFACKNPSSVLVPLIQTEKVVQMRIIPKHGYVVMLHDKTRTVSFFSIEHLKTLTPLKKDEIKNVSNSSNTNFFKGGNVDGKDLVAFIREKRDSVFRSIKINEFGNKDGLKKMRKFEVPSPCQSLRFLTKGIVIATEAGGFQLIDWKEATPIDVIKDPIVKKLNARVLIPVKDGFLACFKELAFCIDLGGKRMQPDFVIEWTGSPNTFATLGDYVIGFSKNFAEVRDISQGKLRQVIYLPGIHHITDNEDPGANPILVSALQNEEKMEISEITLK